MIREMLGGVSLERLLLSSIRKIAAPDPTTSV
jgi:hypothetical protein